MVTRSDRIEVASKKKEIFYSDFDINLTPHPASGLIVKKTNENAVKQSIKTLVLTNLGERLYQPTVGGNVSASLFEPINEFTANDIGDVIKMTIFNHEPRVSQVHVDVRVNDDQNAYDVTILFSIHNRPDVNTLELVLRRNR